MYDGGLKKQAAVLRKCQFGGLVVAILFPSTFGIETELLSGVRGALRNLTGFESTAAAIKANLPVEYPFPVGPNGMLFRLNADNDDLDPTYKFIWQQCTIQYDPKEPGAEIEVTGRIMRLGPAMRHYVVKDLEKVIIHEYMHAALNANWQPMNYLAQHDPINHTIQFNLLYPGHPNPANPAEGAQTD